MFFKRYILSLPSYLPGSGIAFLIDLMIYTILKPILGTSLSGCIGFMGGTITLYSIFRLTKSSKIKRKRYGLFVQFIIGQITLIINLIVLNTIDYLWVNYVVVTFPSIYLQVNFYAFFQKIFASSCGFIWTSSMTMRINFDFDRKNIDKH
tara:strand:+ start:8808 stop:9257 length:450 start_codon:yes stop_codon:yes gene_type:complete